MLPSPVPGLGVVSGRRPRVTSTPHFAGVLGALWPSQQLLAARNVRCLRCTDRRAGGRGGGVVHPSRPLRGHPTAALGSGGSGGDGGNSNSTDGAPLLWSDEDGLVDVGEDADIITPSLTKSTAIGRAGVPAASRATNIQPVQQQQQQEEEEEEDQQQLQGSKGPGEGESELSVLEAALSAIPEHVTGPFQLPDAANSPPGHTPAVSSEAKDDTGWAIGPQAASLLLLTRVAATFEQVLALIDQHGQKLASHHVAMLWCQMRKLLLPSGPLAADGGGWDSRGAQQQQQQSKQQQEQQQGIVMFSSSSSSGRIGSRSLTHADGRARISGARLPPAAFAALRALCAPTARVGRTLPPLGVACALTALAAAAERGFDPGRLQEPVRRRVKSQLCDALVASARAATPQQLAEALLSLGQLGWTLRRAQLLEVSEAAAAAAVRDRLAPSSLVLGPAALLVAVVRANALAMARERLPPSDQLPAAAALFDAYATAASLDPLAAADMAGNAVAAEGPGPPGTALTAAAVLQAVAALDCTHELLAPPHRMAALEAAVELIQRDMRALPPSHAATAAVALRDLGAEPWPAWVQDLHAALSRPGALHALPGPLVVSLLSALPSLGPQPPEPLVESLARAASEGLADCPPALLAAAPVGLLAMRHCPPRYWLEAFWSATAAASWQGVGAMDLAGMVAALGWLLKAGQGATAAVAPPPGWCARVEAALAAATLPDHGSPLPPQHAEAASAALAALRAAEQQQQATDGGFGVNGAGLTSGAIGIEATGPPLFPPTGLLPSILTGQEEDMEAELPLLTTLPPPVAAGTSPPLPRPVAQ